MFTKLDADFPKGWHQTFGALWLGCFITGLGFSMTMPFMPLFMESLGTYSQTQLNFYSGLAFSATYLSQAIMSPLWGSLADQKGRKLMCLRASGVMALTITATGLAQGVWSIIALRFLQGAFSGYINNAAAFIAGETPKRRSGTVLSTMMTANVAGNLLGPLFGGAIAGVGGYRLPFFVTGALMALAFALTAILTKEHFIPITKEKMKPAKEVLASLPNKSLIFLMFTTTLIVQASLMSISPIISLLVKELMHNHGNVSFVSGVVAAAPGFGTLLAARYLGQKMDASGPTKVLMYGMTYQVVMFLPMFFIRDVWLLTLFRFLIGLSSAALLPAVQTVLTTQVDKQVFGRIFSYNQSFQAAGGVVGPLIGSAVSSVFDYEGVFLFTSLLLAINLALIMLAHKKIA